MSIAALLKEQNREMCGIQTYISLVPFKNAQKGCVVCATTARIV